MNIGFWHRLLFWRWRVVGIVHDADEIPEELPRNAAVLVGTQMKKKWIAFDCPCRNGHRVMLNLDDSRTPYWQLIGASFGQLSIAPSVDFHDGARRCHYFIRNSRVIWTKDSVDD